MSLSFPPNPSSNRDNILHHLKRYKPQPDDAVSQIAVVLLYGTSDLLRYFNFERGKTER